MRLKKSKGSNPLPEINLVPMLDVMMTVLTFFIIVSMTLAVDTTMEVQLPSNASPTPSPLQKEPDPLVVEMTKQGLTIKDQPVTPPQLTPQVKTYLAQNPKGVAVLRADPRVPYEQVIRVLGEMQSVGGDRVSLALD
ncbi:MAG: biopolymer transporter ExbD [Cyanobacteria bacterium CAN_BIN43]|nr:biopolymer transporter ExbD [Cyanobacteria bacterium CAN_BIN43]